MFNFDCYVLHLSRWITLQIQHTYTSISMIPLISSSRILCFYYCPKEVVWISPLNCNVDSSLTVQWASRFLISLKVGTPSNHCYVACNRRINLLYTSSHATFNQETRTRFQTYKLGKQTALHWICKWWLFAKVLLWGDDKLLSWWKTNGLFVATFKHMPDSLLKLQLLTKWKKMDILKSQLKI